MRRQISLKNPLLEGDDIREIQRALGMPEPDCDSAYGGITASAVEEWKWKIGYPDGKINGILGLFGQALLFGEVATPADYVRRAEKRKGQSFAPLKNGVARPIAIPTTRTSEFRLPDGPEGAPAPDGNHYHGAKDWFGPAGTPVRAPVSGTIIQKKLSTGHSGQVFGGVVKIQGGDGKVWVFRHVEPAPVEEGRPVVRAQIIGTISAWDGGATHAHIEVWKTAEGGYNLSNMLDPMRFF